jgi:hypothetical protein
MADLTPDSHLLSSIANQGLTWPKVMAELVDNSFDAGATRVVIACKKKERAISVEDDGRGVKDVLSLVTLGRHVEHRTTSLGMYGVGAKDAWLWCGGTIEIDSVCDGVQSLLCVDPRDVQANGWKCDDPTIISAKGATSYTKIRLTLRDGKHQPKDEAFDRIAFIFTPALRRGLQIVRSIDDKRKPLEPYSLPHLQEAVNAEFDIDGKSVSINIGIVPDGEKMRHGPFWLQYGHRIIDSTSLGAASGITTYSTAHVGGVIALGKGWKLTKNKDDLSELNDRLNDAIFCRIEPLLKKGELLSETIESQALRNELESALNAAVKSAADQRKERREKGDTHLRVYPVNTGRRRKNASKTQDGPGSVAGGAVAGRRRGFALDWCNEDPDSIGRFDATGSRVLLNRAHEFVSTAKATNNRAALLSSAYVLIASHAAQHKGNHKLLSFDVADFAQVYGKLCQSFTNDGATNEKQAAR